MRLSLKSYLFILVSLMALFFIVTNVFFVIKLAEIEKKQAEGELFAVLDNIERSLDIVLKASMDILSHISQQDISLEALIKPFQNRYSSGGFVNKEGNIVKSFPSGSYRINVTDRLWFKRVVELRGTIVGHYLVERITNEPGLVIAKSIEKDDGSFDGAAFVVLRHAELQNLLSGVRFPSDSVATIRDTEGVVLARTMEPEKWVGKKFAESEIFTALYGQVGRGSLTVRGIDGVKRVYVHSFVGSDITRGGVYITIGIPAAKVFAPVRAYVLRMVVIFLGILGGAVALTALFSKRFIISPIMELQRATQAFPRDLGTEVRPSSSWPSEFIRLGSTFNTMKEQVIEHESNLKTLIEQIPGVLYRATVSSPVSYIFVSPKVEELVGSDLSLESPFPWFDFIHEEDRERVRNELSRFVLEDEGAIFRSEYRVIGRSGVVKWVRDEAIKIRWKENRMVQGIWRDISWRVKSEQEISLLKSAIEETPDGFALLDEGGRCFWANRAFLKMIGCDEIVYCNDFKELITPFIGLDSQGISFLRALEEGKFWKGRIKAFAEGSKKESLWDISFFLIYGRGGKSVKFIFIRDVTQEVNLQNQLFVAQKMEALGTLATGIAHDFNNILMVILGYTELAMMKLSEGEGDLEKVRSFLEEVFLGGQKAKNLVDQIISFARETPRERMPLSLSVLVKENIKFLQQLMPSGIELVGKIEIASGERDMVLTSPVEFQQLMMNLVVNAVQAIEQRGVIIISLKKCSLEKERVEQMKLPDSREGYLKLSVKDTGCGIDPTIIHRIFDPYFTTKPPGKGTGMGLAIVYNVVKNMNGSIQVESELGKGTVFRMLFPVCEDTVSEKAVVGLGVSESVDLPLSYRRARRILVVDDDEAVLKIIKLELEEKGFYVTTYSEPEEALRSFYESPFRYDAAIIDYRMPTMNGLEVSRQIFNIRLDFPVILLTGFLDEKVEREAKTLGIRGVLGKPASSGEILSVLNSCEEVETYVAPSQDSL